MKDEEKISSSRYKATRSSFSIAKSVIDNLTARKTATLFHPLSRQDKRLSFYTTEPKGRGKVATKPVVLTPQQAKLLIGLCQMMHPKTKEIEARKLIEDITAKALRLDFSPERGITLPMDLQELTKIVYGLKGKYTDGYLDLVLNDLRALSNIRMMWELPKEGGGTYFEDVRLIDFSAAGEKMAGRTTKGKAVITISSPLIVNLFAQYSMLPENFLQMWCETKNNTPLFTMLLLLLANKRYIYIKNARTKTEQLRAKLTAKGCSEQYILTKCKQQRIKCLTYSEEIATFLERLPEGQYTFKTTKGYIKFRAKRFKDDLNRAVTALRGIGIISNYSETLKDGVKYANFVLSEVWGDHILS